MFISLPQPLPLEADAATTRPAAAAGNPPADRVGSPQKQTNVAAAPVQSHPDQAAPTKKPVVTKDPTHEAEKEDAHAEDEARESPSNRDPKATYETHILFGGPVCVSTDGSCLCSAQSEATVTLHIENFRRPFTLNAVKVNGHLLHISTVRQVSYPSFF